MQFGLLGRKLSHSFSPQIHKYLGNYDYTLQEIEPENLSAFMEQTDLQGFNVTIPYKKAVAPFCKNLSREARELGVVNTVVRETDGSWCGHNTDVYGFSYLVDSCGLSVKDKKVLVLGSGGTSATATYVLKKMGAKVVIISRSGQNNYTNLSKHADASVIVNTTPVGMYPNTDETPIDLSGFPNLEGVLDVLYNPLRTRLLQQAEKRGIVAKNGLAMLVAQAKAAAEYFNRSKISDAVIPKITEVIRNQTENLVLIGMPGSGKTTVGKLIAEKLGKPFVDTDAEIEKLAGKTIPEIFNTSGEPGFRALESSVISHIGKQSGFVIATGGGCVTVPENYPALHQNGRIIWLLRNIRLLPTEGRPLSQTGSLEKMLLGRAPLYEAFCDLVAENNATPEETVAEILLKLDWR